MRLTRFADANGIRVQPPPERPQLSGDDLRHRSPTHRDRPHHPTAPAASSTSATTATRPGRARTRRPAPGASWRSTSTAPAQHGARRESQQRARHEQPAGHVLDKTRSCSLEGDFDQYFTLYCPQRVRARRALRLHARPDGAADRRGGAVRRRDRSTTGCSSTRRRRSGMGDPATYAAAVPHRRHRRREDPRPDRPLRRRADRRPSRSTSSRRREPASSAACRGWRSCIVAVFVAVLGLGRVQHFLGADALGSAGGRGRAAGTALQRPCARARCDSATWSAAPARRAARRCGRAR